MVLHSTAAELSIVALNVSIWQCMEGWYGLALWLYIPKWPGLALWPHMGAWQYGTGWWYGILFVDQCVGFVCGVI